MVTLRPINTRPSSAEVSKFGMMLLGGLPVAGLFWTGLHFWRSEVFNPWIFLAFSGVGLVVWLLTAVSQAGGRAAFVCWHALASVIDWALSLIALAIMYFIVLTPMALAMRALGRKPLPLPWKARGDSYWQKRKGSPDLKRFFRQY